MTKPEDSRRSISAPTPTLPTSSSLASWVWGSPSLREMNASTHHCDLVIPSGAQGTVEHHPAQPGNVVYEVPQSEIPFGPVDHVRFFLCTGEVGFGYTLGRDRQKARMIALCDALIQSNEFAEAVEAEVIAPLRAQMISERDRRAAETAATRVDFYTLVRGEG